MSAERERAEIFSRLPLTALRKARDEAASAGRLDMANEMLRALHLRSQRQNEEIENGGRLYEHHHPPSPENSWRGSTTFTGDPLAWMSAFTSGAQICKLNLDPCVVSRQTVDLRAGERVQVLGRDGKAHGA